MYDIAKTKQNKNKNNVKHWRINQRIFRKEKMYNKDKFSWLSWTWCIDYPNRAEHFSSSYILNLGQYDTSSCSKYNEQAGAELCQAQVRLGLAKVDIFFHLIDKLRASSIYHKIEVVFHLPKKLRSYFICRENWGCLPFA